MHKRGPAEALILKLEARDKLSAEERSVIERLLADGSEDPVSRRQDIVEEGDRPTASTLLVEGLTARYRLFPNGGRQITALHVAGDFVDLHSHLLKTMDHGVVALTECRTVKVPHTKLTWISETHPHLWRLLNLCTLIDGAIHREWIAAIGRRTAKQHLAHIMCEQYLLLETVQLAVNGRFEFPITQADLADVLGLSSVHVNRTLQEIRITDLVEWEGKHIHIRNFAALAEIAMFEDTYLHLVNEPR